MFSFFVSCRCLLSLSKLFNASTSPNEFLANFSSNHRKFSLFYGHFHVLMFNETEELNNDIYI